MSKAEELFKSFQQTADNSRLYSVHLLDIEEYGDLRAEEERERMIKIACSRCAECYKYEQTGEVCEELRKEALSHSEFGRQLFGGGKVMGYVGYPDSVKDDYDLIEYELGELKNCPRCGTKPAVVGLDGGKDGICCMTCGACAKPFRTRTDKNGNFEFGVVKSARQWNKMVDEVIQDDRA